MDNVGIINTEFKIVVTSMASGMENALRGGIHRELHCIFNEFLELGAGYMCYEST